MVLAAFLLAVVAPAAADQPAPPEALWKKLEPFAEPPEEFADKFGPYRSPLKCTARSASDRFARILSSANIDLSSGAAGRDRQRRGVRIVR